MKYYILSIKNYANFRGRTSRKEYWMFVLFNILFSIAMHMLDWIVGTDNFMSDSGLFNTIYDLFVLIPGFSAGVRRLHDVDKSGWPEIVVVGTAVFLGYSNGLLPISGILFLLLSLCLLPGFIWLIVQNVKPGTPGTNKYGPNPDEGIPLSATLEEIAEM